MYWNIFDMLAMKYRGISSLVPADRALQSEQHKPFSHHQRSENQQQHHAELEYIPDELNIAPVAGEQVQASGNRQGQQRQDEQQADDNHGSG